MELESNLALRTSHVRNNQIVCARHRPNLGALWPLRNCFRSNKKRLPALELFFGGAYIRNYTVVQGSPGETQQPPSAPPVAISAITPAAPSPSNRTQWSGFNSVVNQSRTRTPSGPGYPLKVVQAKIVTFDDSKPNFERIGQTFVNIAESTANLNHVLTAVREEFGEEYVVTTADGLEVKDSPGTQGEYIRDAWHA